MGESAAESGRILTIEEFRKRLTAAFAEESTDNDAWENIVDKICSFGPRRVGPNLLIDMTEKAICGKL